jgi:CheY-like chemotaxis protein
MTILVLEDEGVAAFYMEEMLRQLGHTILEAHGIMDAKYFWRRRKEVPIDCIIADLNMSTVGSTDTDSAQCVNDRLSAWHWLQNEVLNDAPEFKGHIILYSEYLADLRHKIDEAALRGIKMVPKRGRSGPADMLLRQIDEIREHP